MDFCVTADCATYSYFSFVVKIVVEIVYRKVLVKTINKTLDPWMQSSVFVHILIDKVIKSSGITPFIIENLHMFSASPTESMLYL